MNGLGDFYPWVREHASAAASSSTTETTASKATTKSSAKATTTEATAPKAASTEASSAEAATSEATSAEATSSEAASTAAKASTTKAAPAKSTTAETSATTAATAIDPLDLSNVDGWLRYSRDSLWEANPRAWNVRGHHDGFHEGNAVSSGDEALLVLDGKGCAVDLGRVPGHGPSRWTSASTAATSGNGNNDGLAGASATAA